MGGYVRRLGLDNIRYINIKVLDFRELNKSFGNERKTVGGGGGVSDGRK